MELRQIQIYNEKEILALYDSVGWTAYTDSPEYLRQGFKNSLYTIGAYCDDILVGLIRTVGDGFTIVLIQDLLVMPNYQRQGVGTRLIKAILDKYSHVRQVQLVTDNTPGTISFYRSIGMYAFSELDCYGFMRG